MRATSTAAFPAGAAWAAWVIDITVDPASGRIAVQRLVVGQDTGMMVNPDGVRHQIHGNVIQTLSRSLMEKVAFNEHGVASREWGGYPIIGFRDLPPIEVVLMPRQDEPPWAQANRPRSRPGRAGQCPVRRHRPAASAAPSRPTWCARR
jgi:isoquinoline 1-oxidoreductase